MKHFGCTDIGKHYSKDEMENDFTELSAVEIPEEKIDTIDKMKEKLSHEMDEFVEKARKEFCKEMGISTKPAKKPAKADAAKVAKKKKEEEPEDVKSEKKEPKPEKVKEPKPEKVKEPKPEKVKEPKPEKEKKKKDKDEE